MKQTQINAQVFSVCRQFLTELHNDRAIRALTLDADLEQQLGLGSIEKSELLHRLEQTFQVELPDALLSEGDSLRTLSQAIAESHPYQIPTEFNQFPEIQASNIDPSQCQTLVDALILYAEKEPHRPHIFLQDESGAEKMLSYGLLYQSAQHVAASLQARGLKKEQTVAIMLPTCEAFFYAFFGVLLAGGIPVPIYPPFRANKIAAYIERESNILNNAEAAVLITFDEVVSLSHLLQSFAPELKQIVTIDNLLESNATYKPLAIKAKTPALIQYTSGSTGSPKGVLLTHQNLLANINAIGKAINIQPTDVVVSWLPLYHDMGLIGTWLGSLYYGIPVCIMSPLSFLSHPEKWLWAIHYHRGTITASPNFGYELCLNKIDHQKLMGLDLSSLRIAFNGAEEIYPATMRRFSNAFSRYGFESISHYPVYGLAENAVALTFPPTRREPRFDCIDRELLDNEQRAVPITDLKKPHHEFASCGTALPGHEIRIVDNEQNVLPERSVGHLQFRGPSMMQGYYRQAEKTKAIMHDGWCDTGDFAYLALGEVFITGREKDLIIKAGRNLYPEEIEEIVGEIKDIRKGRVVAFGASNPSKGTEQFIIVAETHATDKKTIQQLHDEVIESVATYMGLPPDNVIIAPPDTIVKTSSGKLKRSEVKQRYLDDTLVKQPLSAKLQLISIAAKGVYNRIKHTALRLAKIFYTLYLVIVNVSLAIPAFIIINIAPPDAARFVFRLWSRWLFRTGFCPVSIENKALLQQASPMIFVANHAGYMDSLLLAAVLPNNVLFITKKELEQDKIIGKVVERVHYYTVDRMDFSNSLKDMERIKQGLAEGKSIMIFPEGTFTPLTGLRPFRLGAFKLATELGVPICPLAIQGTRKMLRGNSLIFTPSRLRVWVGEMIKPESNDFAEVIRLRKKLRKIISEECGERKLNIVQAGPVNR